MNLCCARFFLALFLISHSLSAIEAIGLISSRGSARRNAPDIAAGGEGIAPAIAKEPDAADGAFQPTDLLNEIQPIAATKVLDLSTAISRAMDASPDIAAAAAQVKMRIGEKQQAGLYPNPELTVDLEDFGGSKFLKDFHESDITYVISQDLEFWGKRSARQAVAEQLVLASRWDCAIAKVQLRAKVAHAFIEAAAIQEKEHLADERIRVATEMVNALNAKVESGKAPAISVHREEMALTRIRLATQRLRMQKASAYQALSFFWGNECPDFTQVSYCFDDLTLPPTLCDMLDQIDDHPELSRLEADIQAACRALVAEQREVLPDISFSGGVRQYLGHGAYGFVAEIDIPLPVWNQNQGNISRAQNQISFAINQKESKQRELEKRIRVLHLEIQAMYHELTAMKDQILSKAQASLAFTQTGYEAGKFDYLELLHAQRDYSEIQDQYLDQLLLFHQKWADLQLALGSEEA